MGNLLIETTGGIIQGIEKSDCNAFLGIPFAKAERFMPPRLYQWRGVMPCTSYGSKPVATTFYRTIPKAQEIQMLGSEDCLNINVWTPKEYKGKKLPVVINIFGGACQMGSNANLAESGERFLAGEPEMVYVSANYRLGVLGFMEWGKILGEKYRGSSNNGMRDAILAIEWVHNNIEKFGGDPNRVTLMGLSAGAKTVATLTLCPQVRGLFQQIICESGAVQSIRPIETAEKLTEKYLDILGTRDPDVILSIDPFKLLDAQIKMSDTEGSTLLYGTVFDDELFPESWKEDYEKGTGWKGNALMGSSRNEIKSSFNGAFLAQAQDTIDGLFGKYADYARAEYAKRAEGKDLTEDEQRKIWTKVASDFMYRTYTDRHSDWLSGHGSKVWNYSVEYKAAVHTYGFNLMCKKFGHLALKNTLTQEDMPAANLVGDEIKRRYVSFIVNGDPNSDGELFWPAWTEDAKKKMCFDVECHVMEDASDDTIQTFPEYMYAL